jgi:cytochrome P450
MSQATTPSRPRVADWATDFDILDPAWMRDPYVIFDDLRQRCPVAHTERFNGAYLPVRYTDIRDIAYDADSFSSRIVVLREQNPPERGGGPPLTSDPPRHRVARKALLPAFTPAAIDKLVPKTRAVCRELIDRFAGTRGCDAAVDYAQHIPVKMIAHMLGVRDADEDRFRDWVHGVFQTGITDDAALQCALSDMTEYFRAQLPERRQNPGDDLVSALLAARYEDGRPFTENHVLGSLRVLLLGGIDTTWSAIGSTLWHFATHDQDRRRIVGEPGLIPTAIEEMLRAYSPVSMAREVVKDATVGGCTFKAGQKVLLAYPAANRDPAIFADADKVIIDRKENRHVAFGIGIHRCLGSNLARMEMLVALQEFLTRIREFRLDGEVEWSTGTVRGPRRLPLAFG